MATSPIITYERGTSYVKHRVSGALGLVGELMIGPYCFETLERFAPANRLDFMHLDACDYTQAVMYWLKPSVKPTDTEEEKKQKLANPGRRVLNPMAGGTKVNILMHPARDPSWLQGCIGPGFLGQEGEASTLSYSPQAMEMIYEQTGGNTNDRFGWSRNLPTITFRVLNAFPVRGSLTLLGS